MKSKIFVVLAIIATQSCGSSSTTTDSTEETGQQVGDVMASADEGGGSTGGTYASLGIDSKSTLRTFARLSPKDIEPSWIETITTSFQPVRSAYAGACSTDATFSTCASNVMTRTFSGCTIGTAAVTGTVALTFNDAAVDSTCSLASSGHTVTRVPAFTITGRRGATLTVSKTGTNGQVITKGSGTTFTFSNDGIRRVFTGTSTLDFTTKTTSDITITGTSRSGRTMTGGSWAGTCSDGKTSSLSITGCGTGTITIGTSSTSVTLDRCYST